MNSSELVSIIIRNMGRRGLESALKSAAAQSYPNIEVIVINATAQPYHADSYIKWRPGHTLHQVTSADRLSYPQAANFGIAAARGKFLCFLDDYTRYDPEHVQTLINEAKSYPEALLLYVHAKTITHGDTTEQLFGRPFNRALFFFDHVFFLQAALIKRDAIDFGCRFDESLNIGADHDFLKQIALHGDFVFLPHVPSIFNLLPDSDTLDDGSRASIIQRTYFHHLALAKWAGERNYHTLRSTLICMRATGLFHAGDCERARAAFAKVLNEYPDDPDALHGIAKCDLALDQLDSALRHILGALDLDSENAAYHATAAIIQQRLTNMRSSSTPANAASPIISSKPLQTPVLLPSRTHVSRSANLSTRMALCPCGNSKRYKYCCGKLIDDISANETSTSNALFSATEAMIQNAHRLLQSGEANQAAALLLHLKPQQIINAMAAKTAGEICLQMHLLEPALALLQRAVVLSGYSDATLALYNECCQLIFRATTWRSASHTLQALLNRLNARAIPHNIKATEHIHIVCKLDTIGGTERRALNLYRILSAYSTVTLWSKELALANYRASFPIRQINDHNAPAGGILILVGTYFDCGQWLEQAAFDSVILCHNLSEQYPSLMERLIQIEENHSHPRVKLTFPSQLFMQTTGLSGFVEYPPIDLNLFRRRKPRAVPGSSTRLRIGRHGRDYALKFHPNDPAFFRNLMARGYQVSILGASIIATAFADDTGKLPELLALNEQQPHEFLESLDIFIYRKHPRLFETCGSVIIEAMAMELPVIIFAEQCGAAELINHGQNGFLVDSEPQAIALIEQLANDSVLRESVGQAAKASILELMRRQEPLIIEHYLGSSEETTHEIRSCSSVA